VSLLHGCYPQFKLCSLEYYAIDILSFASKYFRRKKMRKVLHSLRKHCNLMLMALVLTYTTLVPQLGYATDTTPLGLQNVMCNATNMLTGTVGKTIAVIIVISLAISLFLGKVTWGLAIAVLVGMGILFGAPSVVSALAGGANACA
jgi:type IV secretion system protein VirB2